MQAIHERGDERDCFEETSLEISRHFTDKQLMKRRMIYKGATDFKP